MAKIQTNIPTNFSEQWEGNTDENMGFRGRKSPKIHPNFKHCHAISLPYFLRPQMKGKIDGWVQIGHTPPLLCAAPPSTVLQRNMKAADWELLKNDHFLQLMGSLHALLTRCEKLFAKVDLTLTPLVQALATSLRNQKALNGRGLMVHIVSSSFLQLQQFPAAKRRRRSAGNCCKPFVPLSPYR